MAKTTTIQAETRARSGSGVLKQLRREGLLPSVIYGKDFENINLKINAKTFRDILAHSSSDSIVVNLEIDGKESQLAFLKDVQYDAISGQALHADFRAIDAKTSITASIPVILLGTAPGIKSGGVVDQQVHSMEVTCLPADLPETIDIDISELELNDSIHVGEVKLPEGVKTTLLDDTVVVTIGLPAIAPVEEPEEEAVAVEGEEGAAEGEGGEEGSEEKAEEATAEG
ncbi:MAG: 50S ribosomal protein L25 [Akkermansiaceae bacterium]|nr:50S ribosomal protein L25 [Akkermansiaceae bacterium]